MGLEYSIACKTCKVFRDLDKIHNLGGDVCSREDAIIHSKEIEASSFRPALLVSFMARHIGHDCILFSENSHFTEILDHDGYKEDFGFWQES